MNKTDNKKQTKAKEQKVEVHIIEDLQATEEAIRRAQASMETLAALVARRLYDKQRIHQEVRS